MGRDTSRLRPEIIPQDTVKQTRYILVLTALLLCATLMGKVVFLLYNQDITTFTTGEMMRALWHGLPLDVSTVAMTVMPVWILTLMSVTVWPDMPLRKTAGTYLAVATFLMGCITGGTIIMYENWKLLLDASVFNYMSSPGNAGASASAHYIITRIGSVLASSLLLAFLTVAITPHRIASERKGGRHPRKRTSLHKERRLYLLTGILLGVMILGINGRSANEHSAFHSNKIVLNHAAVNPVGHMARSILLYAHDYDNQFRHMPQTRCDSIFAEIFPSDTEDITDTILNTRRPDILTIQLESMGAPFIESLGGVPDVTPELCQWMQRGVNFTNAWATSFRTDRGTVSVLSGYVSYPTASLMMNDSCLPLLPGLAKTLRSHGYTADYMYGGNARHMNKRKYLEAIGFRVWDIEDIDVSPKERDTWGANDSIAMNRMLGLMQRTRLENGPDTPYYWGCQTISSHEPWEVPYSRLENKVHNAFAYTDHCVGQFLDSLSRTPLWDNLLVVLFADHGHTYGLTLDNPEFFHMPLFFVGGAVSRRGDISTIIAQNDIVATILSQMGIPHNRDFPWSRNVFSRNYTYPFAYCNCPAGTLFTDSTGTTMTDLQSGYILNDVPEPNPTRLRNLMVMQQKSYSCIPQAKK